MHDDIAKEFLVFVNFRDFTYESAPSAGGKTEWQNNHSQGNVSHMASGIVSGNDAGNVAILSERATFVKFETSSRIFDKDKALFYNSTV